MDTETNTQPVRKVVAIIGLIAALVLIAWLSITLVKNVPGSFASLASLAESVRSFDASRSENVSEGEAAQGFTENMLVVTSDTNVIESDDSVRLSWTDASAQGSFVFSYKCTAGVNVVIVESNGVRDIDCDANYNLGNTNNINLRVTSNNTRFADIPYSLGFIEIDKTQPSATANAVITVVNEDVAITFNDVSENSTEAELTVTTQAEESAFETSTEPKTEVEETSIPDVTTPATKTPSGETFTQEFTYTIPVSDPNGRIDLATRFLDTGKITNNTFVSNALKQDESGAIQFEVKNLGSKTSEEWTYTSTLPSGGMVKSVAQTPLKPNERAVITIGFPIANIDEYDVAVSIDTRNDNTSLNNHFLETITIN